ncbi:MAG: site-2 protease family protein [Candidatus Sulfotelmatobacter sp.]
MIGTIDLIQILLIAVPVIIAITFHEAAHGFVALRFGDTTARDRGRLTLNPLKHIDPIGTVLIPVILLLAHTGFIFGYAKPVPVNARALRNPKRDMILVAAAGPVTNLILAALSGALFYVFDATNISSLASNAMQASITVNLILAIFNLLPIPPLDGSKIVGGLLPDNLARPYLRLGRFGLIPVLIFLIALPFIVATLGYGFHSITHILNSK